MHPVFHSEFIGLDWPILLIGHIMMFWFLSKRLDWSVIPLTDHEKLCGPEGDNLREKVSLLQKVYQIAKIDINKESSLIHT